MLYIHNPVTSDMKRARVKPEHRFALRVVLGHPQPAIAKIGRFWMSWDGKGWARPHRTWRGALRGLGINADPT